jgi:hypothetical protein
MGPPQPTASQAASSEHEPVTPQLQPDGSQLSQKLPGGNIVPPVPALPPLTGGPLTGGAPALPPFTDGAPTLPPFTDGAPLLPLAPAGVLGAALQ